MKRVPFSPVSGILRSLSAILAVLFANALPAFAQAPTINTHPASTTVTAGETAAFTVGATGGAGTNSTPLKRMMFYYGWLNSFNSPTHGWNNENVAQDLKDYGILVLGDGMQNPSHGDYANTQTIINRVKVLNPGILIFGYVTKAQTLANFQTRATQWNTLGVHGIFLDGAGYDYGSSTGSNTRAALNTRVNYVHGLSTAKIVFANSWNLNHILGTVNDPSFPNSTHNSGSTASSLNSLDWFLVSSHVVNTTTFTGNAGWNDRATFISRTNTAASMSNQYGLKVASLNIVNAGNSAAQAMATAAETGALAGNFDAFGVSDVDYGASSALGPKYNRVDLTGLGTWAPAHTVVTNDSWAQGASDSKYYRVNFTSRTSEIANIGGGSLSFQWRRNGATLPGATAASYTTAPTTTSDDNGSLYSVVVSNAGGSVTSNNATLTVNSAFPPPTITVQPGDRTIPAGETATFAVGVQGAGGSGTNSTPLKRMMFYYGWLNSFNSPTNVWNNENVAQELKDYDLIVLGDGVQDPAHGDFANAQVILARVRALNPNVLIFGYVTKAQSLSAFQAKANMWNNLSVHGIFMDEAGYDYGSSTGSNTRAAFNTRVNYVHGLSSAKIAFANSWNQHHILGTANDPEYPNTAHNSGSTASTLNSSDWFLIESHVINTDAFTGNAGWNDRATFISRTNEAASLSNQYGLKVAGLNILDGNNPAAQTMAWASETGALAGNFDGFGVSDASYGAGTGMGRNYTRVDQFGLGTWAAAPTVVINGAWAQGASDSKYYRVDFTGRTSETANIGGDGSVLTYQWRRNGEDIPGATASSYTTPIAVAADNGAYFSVVVWNASGESVASRDALLTVNAGDFTLIPSKLYFGVEGGMGFHWSPDYLNGFNYDILSLMSGKEYSVQTEVMQLRHHFYGTLGLYFPLGFKFPAREMTDDFGYLWELTGILNEEGTDYFRTHTGLNHTTTEFSSLGANRIELTQNFASTEPDHEFSTKSVAFLDAGQLKISTEYTNPASPEVYTTVTPYNVHTGTLNSTDAFATTVTAVNVNATTVIADAVVTKKWRVASEFPDYVFEASYPLKSLEEVEAFTKRNKHLPHLPSARTMAEKGVDLTEMNLQLLKSLEELTLHVMSLNKEIKSQKSEVEMLKGRLRETSKEKAVGK